MNNEFMGFATDESTASVLREWAGRQGLPSDCVMIGGADLFLSLLESDAPPRLVVVDMDNLAQPIQSAARMVSLCGAKTKLIAIDSVNDVSLCRGMISAGMVDYLLKPLTVEALGQSVAALTRGAGSGPKETKIVVTIGVRGGVGASTTAVNMAWIAAHEMKHKVALLDMDLQFGASALSLDLEPGRGLRDVVSSPQRVDALMLSSSMVAESEDLTIISAEESLDELIHVDSMAISALLKEIKPNYTAIIVDLPRHLIPSQKRLLSVANEVVLVTELSLVGIRDTLRTLTVIKGLGGVARPTVVASRVGPQRVAAVDEATFVKGSKTNIDFILPDDHKNLVTASNTGKTLPSVAPNSPLTKALRQLTSHLLYDITEQKAEKKGLMLFLFGGKGKKEAVKA